MNPAALKMNIKDLKPNGILIVNSDSFGEKRSAQGARRRRIRSRIIRSTAIALFPVELSG